MMKKSNIQLFKIDGYLLVAIILSIFSSIFNLIIPLFIQKFININLQVIKSSKLMLTIFLILFASSTISALSNYLMSVSGDKRIKNIRKRVENQLVDLPYSFYKNITSGELSSRILNDTLIIKEFTTTEIPNAIISLITLVGAIVILFIMDFRITLLIIGLFSLVSLVAYPLGKINEGYSYKVQNLLSKLTELVSENAQNIKVIKLYNGQSKVKKKFARRNNEIFQLSKKIDKIFSLTGPVQTLITLMAFMIIIMYASVRVANNTLSMGMFASFMIYIFEIISPINTLANFYIDYSEAKGAAKVVNNILNTKVEDNQETSFKFNSESVPTIQLVNINFNYSNDQHVLENISMTFEPCKKIAIVGPSGVGKTTLLDILTKINNDFEGQILIDGNDSRKYSLNDWRSLFSVVTQEDSIFYGTIKENLEFGLDYIPSQKQIKDALKFATLSSIIEKNSEGYEYNVGERGRNLSGGQRQKLQIARAYLRNTPFIVFDEATSNLDPESEAEILQAIDKLAFKKTLIIVAHRLSTITNADKIYFMDHHKIEGVGTHNELLKNVKKYRIFVEDQFITKE